MVLKDVLSGSVCIFPNPSFPPRVTQTLLPNCQRPGRLLRPRPDLGNGSGLLRLLVEMLLERGVWRYSGLTEFSWYHFWVDLVTMFPGDVPPHGVVPREGPVTEWAGDSDPLVALPDVISEIRLVAVGSFAKWTFQLSSWRKRERVKY